MRPSICRRLRLVKDESKCLSAYSNVYSNGDYLSLYLELVHGSSPPEWTRNVQFIFTLVNKLWPNPKSNRVSGFLVNKRLVIIAEVKVLPATVKSLENASKTVQNGDKRFNTVVASIPQETCSDVLGQDIQTVKETMDVNGFEVLAFQHDIALTYLKDADFKVDWLEKKLDQLKDNKEKVKSGLTRLQEIEENLLNLKLQ
ncbi:unnamed protein product [Thlaspi arvense]|uniref:MATH domain-containing protein n=1 Tax=Thlaspi arvense TaxID=13288 RepID=A0AAU9RQ38_THLAR|nr:unnamed protein product [Thlaspi arvense]